MAQSAHDIAEDPEPTTLDPLLECVLACARLHGRAISAEGLRSGLPLQDGRLNPHLVERAAQRAGLAAKVVRRGLSRIDKLLLPAILILDDDDACVLLDPVSGRDGNAVRILHPENTQAEVTVSTDELRARYSGYAILIKPQLRYDGREPQLQRTARGHWFWSVLLDSWRVYRDVLLASGLINLFALTVPLFVMNVYDRVVPNSALESLWVLALGAGLVLLFDLALRTLRTGFIELAGTKTDVRLSAQLFERVLGMRLDVRPASTGAFVNSLREFESVREFFTAATVAALVDLPFAVLFLLVIWAIGGYAVWVPLAAIGVLILAGLLVQPWLRRASEQAFRAATQKNAALVESISDLESVKAMGVEGRAQRQLEDAVAENARWGSRSRRLGALVVHLAAFAQQGGTIGVVVLGVYLIGEGTLSLGGLIAIAMLSGRAIAPMAQIAGLLVRFNQSRAALRSLHEVMQMPVERPEEHSFLARPVLEGRVELDDVSFCYPGQERPAVRGVNLRIDSGERVAVIGRVGSGKTTLQRLILGLYAPTEGAVRLGGADARQIDPGDIRRNVGLASPELPLFYGSVRDNITMGIPHADDEAILRAARLAGVVDFVERHPLGFDLPVGEQGTRLSSGQRQSIGLARTFLLDPPILLLDEPTGAMDSGTEARVIAGLRDFLPGRTLLLVTHRAALLDLVDRIVVLENGRVAADGPKTQVLDALRSGRIKTEG